MGIPQVGARTSATLVSIKMRAVHLSMACEESKKRKKKKKKNRKPPERKKVINSKRGVSAGVENE